MENYNNDEYKAFKYINSRDKIDAMELYLIGDGKYNYNMEEVGEKIFKKENGSFTVSLIHRYYKFSLKNKGRYKESCKFEKEHGYRVSRKDIKEYVEKYPDGSIEDSAESFEEFLIKKASKKKVIEIEYEDRDSNFVNTQAINTVFTLNKKYIGIIALVILILLFLCQLIWDLWPVTLICGIIVYYTLVKGTKIEDLVKSKKNNILKQKNKMPLENEIMEKPVVPDETIVLLSVCAVLGSSNNKSLFIPLSLLILTTGICFFRYYLAMRSYNKSLEDYKVKTSEFKKNINVVIVLVKISIYLFLILKLYTMSIVRIWPVSFVICYVIGKILTLRITDLKKI